MKEGTPGSSSDAPPRTPPQMTPERRDTDADRQRAIADTPLRGPASLAIVRGVMTWWLRHGASLGQSSGAPIRRQRRRDRANLEAPKRARHHNACKATGDGRHPANLGATERARQLSGANEGADKPERGAARPLAPAALSQVSRAHSVAHRFAAHRALADLARFVGAEPGNAPIRLFEPTPPGPFTSKSRRT